MKTIYKSVLSALFIGATLISCEKENIETFENGIFIVNEGAWGNSNASISFINEDNEVKENIFEEKNGYSIGDVLQSMTIYDDKAYLVVNASNKIEVVNSSSFETQGVIADLESPRYLVEKNDQLYISQWGKNGSVEVVDANTLKSIKTIETGIGSEGLIVVDNEIWVANSGGYGSNNNISIINAGSNEVTETITLDADNPRHFVKDSEGDIWVLASGKIIFEYDSEGKYVGIKEQTPSKLIEIDASNKEIKNTITLSEYAHYGHLKTNSTKDKLYYGGGYGIDGIFEMSISATEAPSAPIISGYFYGFNVNKDNNVFGTLAPDFSSNGTVKEFDSDGNEIENYTVGVGPNSVVFNN
ncbi:MAG: DUF5074 domain-containing protein [Bacteroidota bacterium]